MHLSCFQKLSRRSFLLSKTVKVGTGGRGMGIKKMGSAVIGQRSLIPGLKSLIPGNQHMGNGGGAAASQVLGHANLGVCDLAVSGRSP